MPRTAPPRPGASSVVIEQTMPFASQKAPSGHGVLVPAGANSFVRVLNLDLTTYPSVADTAQMYTQHWADTRQKKYAGDRARLFPDAAKLQQQIGSLESGQFANALEKHKLRKSCVVRDGCLYKKRHDSNHARYFFVVPNEQAHGVLVWAHSQGLKLKAEAQGLEHKAQGASGSHAGRDVTYETIAKYFSTDNLSKDVVAAWLKLCPHCRLLKEKTAVGLRTSSLASGATLGAAAPAAPLPMPAVDPSLDTLLFANVQGLALPSQPLDNPAWPISDPSEMAVDSSSDQQWSSPALPAALITPTIEAVEAAQAASLDAEYAAWKGHFAFTTLGPDAGHELVLSEEQVERVAKDLNLDAWGPIW